jgi:hypothetical protein
MQDAVYADTGFRVTDCANCLKTAKALGLAVPPSILLPTEFE